MTDMILLSMNRCYNIRCMHGSSTTQLVLNAFVDQMKGCFCAFVLVYLLAASNVASARWMEWISISSRFNCKLRFYCENWSYRSVKDLPVSSILYGMMLLCCNHYWSRRKRSTSIGP